MTLIVLENNNVLKEGLIRRGCDYENYEIHETSITKCEPFHYNLGRAPKAKLSALQESLSLMGYVLNLELWVHPIYCSYYF